LRWGAIGLLEWKEEFWWPPMGRWGAMEKFYHGLRPNSNISKHPDSSAMVRLAGHQRYFSRFFF
jgi:hypothetical protein